MPDQWTVSLGEAHRDPGREHGIGREAQDVFAEGSHHKAAAAWEKGVFADESSRCPGPSWTGTRTSARHLGREAGQAQAGVPTGRHRHRRQRVPLNDGAAALLIADQAGVDSFGGRPLARIAARAAHAVEPQFFGIGPVEAANKALARAGIGWSDLSVSSSTRRSPPSRWPVCRCGRSWIRPSSTRTRRDRHRAPARLLRGPHPGSLAWELHRRVAAGGWPPSASASARAWPSSWKPEEKPVKLPHYAPDGDSHPPNSSDPTGPACCARRTGRLQLIPQHLTEITGPLLGPDRIGERDHDLTDSTSASRWASASSSAAGCSMPTAGRCRTRCSSVAGQLGGRYAHDNDRHDAPLDPNFSGVGRTVTDARVTTVRHHQARRLPVAQPRQRLAARAHPLLPVRPAFTSG